MDGKFENYLAWLSLTFVEVWIKRALSPFVFGRSRSISSKLHADTDSTWR
jgi:hypothetical protein